MKKCITAITSIAIVGCFDFFLRVLYCFYTLPGIFKNRNCMTSFSAWGFVLLFVPYSVLGNGKGRPESCLKVSDFA